MPDSTPETPTDDRGGRPVARASTAAGTAPDRDGFGDASAPPLPEPGSPADGLIAVDQLDHVTVVDVAERERGIYVFGEPEDAARFADAVDSDPEADREPEQHRAFAEETLVNLGDAAERLIAAERGDTIEEDFGPGLAEDIREGMPLPTALEALNELGEGRSRSATLIRHWIGLDAAGGGEVRSAPDSAAMPFTVVGCEGRGGLPFVISVAAVGGPEEALDLARLRWEEKRDPRSDVELEIVAIFHGSPRLADLGGPADDEDSDAGRGSLLKEVA